MNCKKCGGKLVADIIDAGRYDCCVLSCGDCDTIIDKTWNKKAKED